MRSRKIGLKEALRLGEKNVIALTGAGGKTSLLFSLAREYSGSVLLSATAHLGIEQLTLADRHIVIESEEDLLPLKMQIPRGVSLLTGPKQDDARVGGLDPELIEAVHQLAVSHAVPLIMECDGARMLPLKAPARHEPPVPDFVDTAIVTAGLSGLRKPIRDVVHRMDRFCDLADKDYRDPVEADDLVKVLLHEDGGLKNIPPEAAKIVVLNQTQTDRQKAAARRIAPALLQEYDLVLAADVVLHRRPVVHSVYQKIAGVILAAGEAKRMGQPKQLLNWGGSSLIRRVAETALDSDLDEVVVVLGANADIIREAIEDLPVKFVINDHWADGQSASIRAGLQVLSSQIGGVVFLLADQPRMTSTLINEIVRTHQNTFQPITLPMIDGRRGNPALFDRRTFQDLSALQGDSGGRQLFSPL